MHNRVRLISWIALALIALTPALAPAQMRSRDPAVAFDRADTNKDGKITRREYANARTARFAEMDRNRDGVISKADFPRAGQHPQAAAKLDAMIAESDANKDGQVSKTELSKAPMPIFDRADSNHNGAVDQAELAALKASRGR